MTTLDTLANRDTSPESLDWLECANWLRGSLAGDSPAALKTSLTNIRSRFLQQHFVASRESTQPGQGSARSRLSGGQEYLDKAHLLSRLPHPETLPLRSSVLTLGFQLATPLLTKDDDPFYLFENPVRRDHLFGVPYLSAAAIKGLSADAYQRAFPGDTPWKELVPSDSARIPDPARTLAFRRNDLHAMRLFGAADDGAEDAAGSQRGRLHFSPAWFRHVQYLIMNPGDPTKGTGKDPIQFEAIAPMDEKGRPATGEKKLALLGSAKPRLILISLCSCASCPIVARAEGENWVASGGHWSNGS